MLAKAHQRSDGRGIARVRGLIGAAVLFALPLSIVGSAEASAADPIRTVLGAVVQTASTQVPIVADAAPSVPAMAPPVKLTPTTNQSTSSGTGTRAEPAETPPASDKPAGSTRQTGETQPAGFSHEPSAHAPASQSNPAPAGHDSQSTAHAVPGALGRPTGAASVATGIVRDARSSTPSAPATPAVVPARNVATAVSRAALTIATGKAATPLATALAESKARVIDALSATTSASGVGRSLAKDAPAVAAVLTELSTTANAIVAATRSIAQPAIAELLPLDVPPLPLDVPPVAALGAGAPAKAAAGQIAGSSSFAVAPSGPPRASTAVATADEARSAGPNDLTGTGSEARAVPETIAVPGSPVIASSRSSTSVGGLPAAQSNRYSSAFVGSANPPSHAEQRAPAMAPPAVRASAPSPDGGSTAASAGGAGGGLALTLSLAALLLLALPSMLRRLRLVIEPWRLSPFMLIADRPG